MKPASSAKRAKRAKAAAKAAKERLLQSSKPKSKKSPGTSFAGASSQTGKSHGEYSQDMTGLIPHSRPTMGRQEQQAVAQTVRSGSLASGKEVEALEEEFCRYLGIDAGHALAVSNFESALYLALIVLKADGKDIAIPAFSQSGIQKACRLAGAKIKLIDNDEQHPHIDLQALAAANLPFAVISHTFGLPVSIKGANLPASMIIIEDCSEALGAKLIDGAPGTAGNAAVFSLAADSIITSGGEGGMLVCADKNLIDEARSFFNFTMTDLQASIGRVQLAKIANLMARREEIFSQYKDSGFDLFENSDPNAKANFYRAVLRTKNPQTVLEFLARGMIETQIPVKAESFAGLENKFPAAEKLSKSTLSLPIYPHLSNAEAAEIIAEIEAALEFCQSKQN